MTTKNFFPDNYRDVKDIDVIQYSDLKELNIDTPENFREARKEVFEELKIFRGFVEKFGIEIPADVETYEELHDFIGTFHGMAWEEYYSETQEQTKESESEYRVTWEIDIPAYSEKEAAEKAQNIMRDKESIASVFKVSGPNGMKEIDLLLYADLERLQSELKIAQEEAEKNPNNASMSKLSALESDIKDVQDEISDLESIEDVTQESQTKETPGPWLVLSKEQGTDPNSPVIAVIHDKESHAKNTEEATGGNVEFDYIPLSVVKAAPKLLKALKFILEDFKEEIFDRFEEDDDEWKGGSWEEAIRMSEEAIDEAERRTA